jgi:hypothetical protein
VEQARLREGNRRTASKFNGFHDACLREVAIATETYVDVDGAMSCPGHLDTSALLYLQSQSEALGAIELRCIGVSHFHLNPTPENCDSIISSGAVRRMNGAVSLALRFLGGPLTGPPNSGVWLPSRSGEEADVEIVAQAIEWRPVPGGLGNRLRFRLST